MVTILSYRSLIPQAYASVIRSRQQLRNYAAGTAGRSINYALVRMQPEKSVQVALKELADLPHDVGIIPGTFIMPTGAARPSIIREPGLRWQLEMHRLKARFQNLREALTYKFFLGKRPFPKLARRNAVATATALHKRMYTAFSENDVLTLSSICTDGLLASFKARLASNPPNVTQQWVLHRYIKSPRLVSDRASMLQVKDSAVRQVVVRIQSTQSLTKTKKGLHIGGQALAGATEKKRETDEYIVIQRIIWKGQEGGWRIWGTTQESSVNEVLWYI